MAYCYNNLSTVIGVIMSKVIQFPERIPENDPCCYAVEGDRISISDTAKSILAEPIENDLIKFTVGDCTNVYGRKDLAEFLHCVTAFLDSEDRFKPDCDLVGMNY